MSLQLALFSVSRFVMLKVEVSILPGFPLVQRSEANTFSGYTSNAAKGLQQQLAIGGEHFNVHSRVLGNVLYLMSSVTSKPESLKELESLLRSSLL